MKLKPILYDFKSRLPVYRKPQEYALGWLADAHTKAEIKKSVNSESLSDISGRMERLIRRYGCSPKDIGWRSSELSDFTHTQWEEMRIFNVMKSPEGENISIRNQFYSETVNRVVNELYIPDAPPPSDIIHVTCTGYNSPNVIQRLIDRKGWGLTTRSTQVYHMGCYAAIPAIRVSAGLLLYSGNNKHADIVHTELCTLHFNPQNHSPEQLVVQSLFADGHIRYSISFNETSNKKAFEVLAIREELIPESQDDMTWVVSESGFQMTLSREVPNKISTILPSFMERLFIDAGENIESNIDNAIFAIHPGGPKIINSVQKLLNIPEDKVMASRVILYEHGNMSSATLPHIWSKILDDPNYESGSLVVSLAFGPGLTVAGALFRKL